MSGAGEKTEKPTARRIDDARKKGQVAKSADLTAALVIGAILMILTWYGPSALGHIVRIIRHFMVHQLADMAGSALTMEGFLKLFNAATLHMMMLMAPFLLGAMVMGVLVNLFQVKPLFATEAIKPNLKKLNPIEGFKRLFSQRAFIELGKGLLKIAVVSAVCFGIIQSQYDQLLGTSQMAILKASHLLFQLILSLTFGVVIALLAIGVVDWKVQIYQLMKQLRMTKQEIKDEMRNTEGNPEVKRKIKSQGQAMARKRMLANVPKADVILVNPTHYSVAIQYDPDECPAPRVIAKGVDALALKIREIAREHQIPIVENKPLARSLYDAVEVEHMIPPHLFVAVAQVLAFVFTKSKGRKTTQRRWAKVIQSPALTTGPVNGGAH